MRQPNPSVSRRRSSGEYQITSANDATACELTAGNRSVHKSRANARHGSKCEQPREGTATLFIPEVVERKAFECNISDEGILCRVVHVESEDATAANGTEENSTETGSRRIKERRSQQQRRPSDRVSSTTNATSAILDPLNYCEQCSGMRQRPSARLWGVDLHLCDLSSFVGVPAKGQSPWGSNSEEEDNNEEGSDVTEAWRCVFLDASLNRLIGINAIAEQAGLRDVVVLDVSCNLMNDLDGAQRLSDLQVLVASNNQLQSAATLGRMEEGCRLGYVDISNNNVSVLPSPRSPHGFRCVRTLLLARNRLTSIDDATAELLTSLERLDISENEFAEVDSVELMPALKFLDCSGNRISDLSAFVGSLTGPSQLKEVVAYGNPVVSEPQYRLTVLMNCQKISRLDHRTVDRAALTRRFQRIMGAKDVSDIREVASTDYFRTVEDGRQQLERRKQILKNQQKQLDEAFEEFRVHRHKEVGECIAYAESLRRDDENTTGSGLLTPEVARSFRDALERRPSSDSWGDSAERSNGDGSKGQNLSKVLHAVVVEQGARSNASDTTDSSNPSRTIKQRNISDGREKSIRSNSSSACGHKSAENEASAEDISDVPSELGSRRRHRYTSIDEDNSSRDSDVYHFDDEDDDPGFKSSEIRGKNTRNGKATFTIETREKATGRSLSVRAVDGTRHNTIISSTMAGSQGSGKNGAHETEGKGAGGSVAELASSEKRRDGTKSHTVEADHIAVDGRPVRTDETETAAPDMHKARRGFLGALGIGRMRRK